MRTEKTDLVGLFCTHSISVLSFEKRRLLSMDIVIKSFNRPYYLERCLRSIEQFVVGEYTILILDDGTPRAYLERIQILFPFVRIAYSPAYNRKSQAITKHVRGEQEYDQFTIPIAFWIEEIAQCSDVFLLLEDDIWLTGPLLLEEIQVQFKLKHIAILRLSWQGNPILIAGEKNKITDNIEEIVPRIPFLSKAIFLNRFRMRSVLYHLGIMRMIGSDFRFQLPIYTLYAVASAFFDKKYWLYLWEKEQTVVEESLQLHKAAQWHRLNTSRYAKTVGERAQTSYITSATNGFEGIRLDMIRLNHYFNEAWLRGELDVMDNFPQDIRPEVLRPILELAQDAECTYTEWQRWITRFKDQYRNAGCVVE